MKKPIYNIFTLTARNIILTLALVSAVQSQGADGEVTTGELSAKELEGLKLQLVSPMTSGTETLTGNDALERYFVVDGSNVIVHLNGLAAGQHRLSVKMQYGTQVEVLAVFDLVVPANLAAGDDEREVQISVVETIGDGDNSGADASVYAKDGDGNAHITKPLNISGSVQEGSPYGEYIYELNVVVLTPEQKAEVEAETGTAYDYCDENDTIPDGVNVTIYADEECTQKVGSTAKTEYADTPLEGDFFKLQNGESISAGTYYARVERRTSGENSHAEGEGTTASGENSHAEGEGTTASGYASHAEGTRTTASGDRSHAEGEGTIASKSNQHVCGQYNVEDANGDYALIVGNGADDQNRSNAFAIDWNGNLVLFNNGTPVVLTPAKLAQLIA